MDPEITFGAWLRQRRRTLDLTQKELARQVGCAVVTIRKFETDTRRPSKELAERLAACLALASEAYPNFIAFARAEPYLEAVSPPPVATAPLPRPPPAGRSKSASAPRHVNRPLPAFLKQKRSAKDKETPPVFVAREQELAELGAALGIAKK